MYRWDDGNMYDGECREGMHERGVARTGSQMARSSTAVACARRSETAYA